jgi:hypothetical protein
MIRWLRSVSSLLTVVISLTIPARLLAQSAESAGKPCGCPDAFPGLSNASRAPDGSAYYLYPYNLHLVAGARSAVPLQLRDALGNVITGPISFSGYDNSLISISSDGYVTAKRAETASEIGTWVNASISGGSVANTCVVRVLSTNYNFSYASAEATNTILYYPTSINGENISSYVTSFEMAQTLDYAYRLERSLMSVTPFYGCKQIYEIDFGESETQRVCGISGNPIRIGWGAGGNTWQNCFLVPFIPPRSPQWGVMFHELGHNMTMVSYSFSVGFGITDYVEGLATAIGMESSCKIVDGADRYSMSSQTRSSIAWVLNRDSTNYIGSLQAWLNNGGVFSSYNADITDGVWLYYRRNRPADFAQRFFAPLRPDYETLVSPYYSAVNASGNNGKHTFFAALVSAAVGRDLSAEFTGTFHFPIVPSLFNNLYVAFVNAIDLAALKAGPASAIAVKAGNNQTSLIGSTISQSLVARVTNTEGFSVSGVNVSFAITGIPAGSMGQSLSMATSTTNSSGEASTTLTLGNKAGTYLVTATSPALAGSSLTFESTALNPAPTLSNLSANRAGRGSRINLTLVGSNLIDGVSTASLGSDVSINSLTVVSSTQMNLNISVSAAASMGTRNVSVTNPGPGGGTAALTGAFTIDSSPATGVEVIAGSLPREYGLSDAYPNPFNPSTTIQFALPTAGRVSLKVFDMLGKEIATLVAQELGAGYYSTTWYADSPSGTYVYRLQAGTFVETKKMVVLR